MAKVPCVIAGGWVEPKWMLSPTTKKQLLREILSFISQTLQTNDIMCQSQDSTDTKSSDNSFGEQKDENWWVSICKTPN